MRNSFVKTRFLKVAYQPKASYVQLPNTVITSGPTQLAVKTTGQVDLLFMPVLT